MKKLFRIIDQILEMICFGSIAGFTFLIFLQVFCRYVLKSPLHWQEEICLYLFYIVVLAGSAQAIKNYEHVSVDFVSQRLSKRQQIMLRIVVSILVTLCCIYITSSGYLYTTNVGNRRSGELRILMKYVYSLFPVFGSIMSIYSVKNLVENCIQYFRKEEI